MDTRQWFVVKAKPRCETLVRKTLSHRGVDVYLPLMPVRSKPGRSQVRLEPLFPGYLFARLSLGSQEWVAARSAPGVVRFLGAAGAPSAVPDELVESIRSRVETRVHERWQPSFQSGERVAIGTGAFRGLEAIFEGQLSASGRVRVLLEVVGRLVPVDLDVALLRRAG